MYAITIHEPTGQFPYDTPGTLIHSERGHRDLKAKFKIDLVYEGVSSMTIEMLSSNPYYDQLMPFKTLIKVRSLTTGKDVFKGRIMDKNYNMDSDGKVVVTYVCENRLAFLHDSTQEWRQVQDTTIKDFFKIMVDHHNSKVESYKQFKVGDVTVTNNTDNVYRFIDYGDTLDEIKDNLTSRLGGILRIRDENDGMYLDYLEGITDQGEDPITLRRNLKSFKKHIDPTEIISRVYVYGKRLEDEDEDEDDEEVSSVSTPRLTMASANNSKTYLEDEDLIDEYGVQEGILTYDDISEARNLVSRAQTFLDGQKAAKETYDIEAVNLHLIDSTFDALEVGHWYDIRVYPLLDIEDNLQIIEMSIDSENPQRNKLKIGDKTVTLSEYQASNRQLQKSVSNLESIIITENQRFNSRYKTLEEQYEKDREKLREEIDRLIQASGSSSGEDSSDSTGGGNSGGSTVGGGSGSSGGSRLPPVFPVDYNRSGINFWTNSNGMYYGAPRDGGARQHAGFDIGGGGRTHPIYAVQDGVVTFAGNRGGGLGNYITIRHTGDNYHTLYGHLASMSVSNGQTVKRGQQIGMMGATGGNYAIHLHLELSRTGNFHTISNTLDPAPYLGVTANNRTSLQNPVNV